MLHVVSVNVGCPREVEWNGRAVRTAIFKEPVQRSIALRSLNFDGDRQADLSVHGGPDKAVYVYPAEHYDFWHKELPDTDFTWGMFGENLTVLGLSESDLAIGDRLRIGTAEVVVRQPRVPCYKLGVRFGRADMTKRFYRAARTGFYVAVAREGEVGAGDAIELVDREPHHVTVADIYHAYTADHDQHEAVDPNLLDLMCRAAALEALPDVWRSYFVERLALRTPA
ncbi:MAG TPA: MOSC domain-containing protein [Ktedonobacterales bacterium]|nr:MOSC domain-containing protein [Ktedonobacterales bacterium]